MLSICDFIHTHIHKRAHTPPMPTILSIVQITNLYYNKMPLPKSATNHKCRSIVSNIGKINTNFTVYTQIDDICGCVYMCVCLCTFRNTNDATDTYLYLYPCLFILILCVYIQTHNCSGF